MNAFKGEANGKFVNHKDSCRSNNKLSNLEYVTQAENIRHAIDAGHPMGHGMLKIIQYDLQNNYITTHISMSQASKATGAKSAVIVEVCKRRRGRVTAGGFKWRYHTSWGEGKSLDEYDELKRKIDSGEIIIKDDEIIDEEKDIDEDTTDEEDTIDVEDEVSDDAEDEIINTHVQIDIIVPHKIVVNLSKLKIDYRR